MTETPAPENSSVQPDMTVKPQAEHDWLHRLIGDWDFSGECFMGPDQPAMKSTGAFTVRSLGGVWIVCEGVSDALDGTPAPSIITLGYDPQKARFVGSFVAGCMTRLWTYEGSLNEAGNALALDTEGPGFSEDGALVPYRDVYEIVSDDHWTLTSLAHGEDGQWFEFMKAHYRRKA